MLLGLGQNFFKSVSVDKDLRIDTDGESPSIVSLRYLLSNRELEHG